MISIDQNCQPLWDVFPKLDALLHHGKTLCQYVEDIDVAFTSMGSSIKSGALRIERERFYRSGGADWGAALFYSEFLGRLPCEIRNFETFSGMKTDVLAHHLQRSVDDLYDHFSPGDNWQLIGPSYVGDSRRHRTMGDLSWAETEGYLRQIMGIAQSDMLKRFPQKDSTQRTGEWFTSQHDWLDQVNLQSPQTLSDVYTHWLKTHYSKHNQFKVQNTRDLFRIDGKSRFNLLELFVHQYERAASLYNRAITETRLGLRPLSIQEGELPFFAVYRHDGHVVRSGALLHSEKLQIADLEFDLAPGRGLPFEAMRKAGVIALAGKAIVLVLQVRLGPDAKPLTLPYHGSMYMPAAYRLQKLLIENGLLNEPVKPVVRVRLRFLDRIKALDTVIALPTHLVPYFGRDEISSRDLSESWFSVQVQAQERLERFRTSDYRQQWMKKALPEVSADIDRLDLVRRELAQVDSKNPQLRDLWKQVKPLKIKQLDALLRQIDSDIQASQLDYYDSRGAIWPWSIALGGEAFYNEVVHQAEFYEEQE